MRGTGHSLYHLCYLVLILSGLAPEDVKRCELRPGRGVEVRVGDGVLDTNGLRGDYMEDIDAQIRKRRSLRDEKKLYSLEAHRRDDIGTVPASVCQGVAKKRRINTCICSSSETWSPLLHLCSSASHFCNNIFNLLFFSTSFSYLRKILALSKGPGTVGPPVELIKRRAL